MRKISKKNEPASWSDSMESVYLVDSELVELLEWYRQQNMHEHTRSHFSESVSDRRLWQSNLLEMLSESWMHRVKNSLQSEIIISSILCIIRRISLQNEGIWDSEVIRVLSGRDLLRKKYTRTPRLPNDIVTDSNSTHSIVNRWKRRDSSSQLRAQMGHLRKSWRSRIIPIWSQLRLIQSSCLDHHVHIHSLLDSWRRWQGK